MECMPLIGITPGYDYDNNRMYIRNGYTEGIIRAGGLPFLIPLTSDKKVWEEALAKCDGALISGGPDIDARYFGEINRPFNGDISPLWIHLSFTLQGRLWNWEYLY
jgi:putative glutamine amidotransferase